MLNGVAPNLPQDITVDILSRLPAKPLCTFKSVSKPWKSLISNTHLIKKHLDRNIHNNKLVIISPSQRILFSIEFDEDHTHGLATKLKFNNPNLWAMVMGSCNGLLFAVGIYGHHFLLNPSTRESTRVPALPHVNDPSTVRVIYGFGYDHSSSDYKVIAISHHHTHNNDIIIDDSIDVYSVKLKEWRRVGKSFYHHTVSVPWQGVYLNGSVHYLAYSDVLVIAAFSLSDEVFNDLPAPNVLDSSVNFYDLLVLGGCLCIVACCKNRVTEIWMMKKYGVRDSWIKYTISRSDLYPVKVIGLLGEKEILMKVYGDKMVKYDLVEEAVTDVMVDGITDDYEIGASFVESLVSPNGAAL